MNIFDILLNQPLGALIKYIYDFVLNYGVALIIFTIITKIILFPLALKQQKSMDEQKKIQPLVAAVQKKYANDKNKQQEEMMKLYSEHKINPLAGCLPLLIQLPILFALFSVIRKPLTFMMHWTPQNILEAANKFAQTPITELNKVDELLVAKQSFAINFDFLGMDLSAVPHVDFGNFFGSISILWLIPILATVTTYLSMKLSSAQSGQAKQQTEQEKQTAQTMNTMTSIMPLMTLWFTFTMPAALGLYWTISNLIQMLQQVLLTKYKLFNKEAK